MSNADTKQDREAPGPEWFSKMPPGHPFAEWAHPVLRITVQDLPASRTSELRVWESPDRSTQLAMPAIEACRAISAAALHWERQKGSALLSDWHNLIVMTLQDIRSRQ